jgi:riboflavin synthase
VQGHVDGVGGVWDLRDEGFSRVVTIGVPPELMRYVVEKGSIAIDGVSLTISALGDDWIQVSLIPETLERTILGEATTGQVVNLEVDVLAKYVERLVVSAA